MAANRLLIIFRNGRKIR